MAVPIDHAEASELSHAEGADLWTCSPLPEECVSAFGASGRYLFHRERKIRRLQRGLLLLRPIVPSFNGRANLSADLRDRMVEAAASAKRTGPEVLHCHERPGIDSG
jgi:hypothetical protein